MDFLINSYVLFVSSEQSLYFQSELFLSHANEYLAVCKGFIASLGRPSTTLTAEHCNGIELFQKEDFDLHLKVLATQSEEDRRLTLHFANLGKVKCFPMYDLSLFVTACNYLSTPMNYIKPL